MAEPFGPRPDLTPTKPERKYLGSGLVAVTVKSVNSGGRRPARSQELKRIHISAQQHSGYLLAYIHARTSSIYHA